MQLTGIEWTDFSANPLKYRDKSGKVVWGCTKKSGGCANCYSEAIAQRFNRGGPFTRQTMEGLTPFLDEKELRRMLTCKPASGKRCFVGDMTDLFGDWVPDDILDQLFAVFALRSDVTWQVLTKRAERMRAYLSCPRQHSRTVQAWAGIVLNDDGSRKVDCHLPEVFPEAPFPNVWLGVSVEDRKRLDKRAMILSATPAAVRFWSVEPLLEDLGNIRGYLEQNVDWVIVGGESGANARPCNISAVRSIVQQCKEVGVACFVKQLGRCVIDPGATAAHSFPAEQCWPNGTESNGQRISLIDRAGGEPIEWPEDLRARQFPEVAHA